MTPNLVSCYCPTYGRAHCLEEAIECFLRQDYAGPKELVILNDYSDQQLSFDHPEVKVYNLPYRITPLGAKFNGTVALCSGDVLMCWEDDDIYLPNRISYSLSQMQDEVFHTVTGFLEAEQRVIPPSSNLFHATHALTKRLFDEIGGYPEKDQCSIDVEFIQKINDKLKRQYSKTIPIEDAFYIYRWSSIDSYHGSGWGPDKTDVSEAVEKLIEAKARQGSVPTGLVELKPNWRYEYGDFVVRA